MSTQWVTLKSIKTAEVSRITSGVTALKADLKDYALAHSGLFLIYGSIARSDYRFHSDVDVLVDFPAESTSKAWRFCEDACRKYGLVPDVRPKVLCSAQFLQRIDAGRTEACGER